MQAATALAFSTSFFPCAPPSKNAKLLAGSTSSRFASIRMNALSVNYNSAISVFPAEACEAIGGDTCLPDIYPEVKLRPEEACSKPRTVSEAVDREYLDYTSDIRTVLLGEACDVLGGEFCEAPYQTGVC